MSKTPSLNAGQEAREFRTTFRRRLIWRIVLLVITVCAMIIAAAVYYTVFDLMLIAACVLLGLAVLGQTLGLLTMVERSHRTFEQFLDAVAHGDITQRFSGGAEHSPVLAQAINEVMEKLRDAYSERETQATFLQALVKHVPVALISLRAGGELALSNNAARRLLERSISDSPDGRTAWLAGIADIPPGQERLMRVRATDRMLDLKISATEIRMRGDVQKLFAIENMTSELEASELAAWRDLIRVLTHEIMNSVTPITSLARTVESAAESLNQGALSAETAADLEDIRAAVRTIGRRGEGLLAFLESYRSMTRVPEPVIDRIAVGELFNGLERLLVTDFAAAGVKLSTQVDPVGLTLEGDSRLLEQALINVLTNAREATGNVEGAEVWLRGRLSAGHITLEVEDNGAGMDQATVDQIFIPFYTTKRGGSGIGMTLSKQIARAHGGQILVDSKPQHGTRVRLVL